MPPLPSGRTIEFTGRGGKQQGDNYARYAFGALLLFQSEIEVHKPGYIILETITVVRAIAL